MRARTLGLVVFLAAALPAGGATFVNFETPQVHPLDLSPDRMLLAAVNTADSRLMLFDVADGNPRMIGNISVGLDPVSVRFHTQDEIWVVNQISDSVSVVDVPTRRVRVTLATLDEPADVVFAGDPERAFVSCSQDNAVQVFDPRDLGKAPRTIRIDAEDPRALAVSPDGKSVYAAVFESGNSTTLLPGGLKPEFVAVNPSGPGNVVSDADGPYGGQNPPPNSGDEFAPPIASDLPTPPPVSLIVRRDPQGRWRDDNGADWTDFVSGSRAGRSFRRQKWDVIDHDVAVIDANRLSVRYIDGLMNLCMALAVHPDGRVTVVGTDATNEIRFEPVLNGVFLRVEIALAGAGASVVDLNPHLTYGSPTVPKAERDLSIGDPRGIVWSRDGSRGYVAGMGSDNVVVIDAGGHRVDPDPIAVETGPTGLALDDDLGRLYVLNRFNGSISVVDVDSGRQIDRVKFFDPTPRRIRKGRPFLYDTHRASGLGHVSCASCHPDARMDRLAWDLGVPNGSMKPMGNQNLTLIDNDVFTDWHPMKGPMMTQTLQDIIGKEPHHWRGDRDGIEEFNPAFTGLLGAPRRLTRKQMQQFERFLATIHFPPNPFRNFDNTLPTAVVLEGHVTNGRFGPAGQPLPVGDAVRGMQLFRSLSPAGPTCVFCHALPTGAGTPMARDGDFFRPIPAGPQGEAHLALIGDESSTQHNIKVPHLRNLYDKVGMNALARQSRGGFGFFHDGSFDSLSRFVGLPSPSVKNDQDVADLVALMLAFSGSGFDVAAGDPPGVKSQDAHAAVGRQATISGPRDQASLIADMLALAAQGAVDLVVKGAQDGKELGWLYGRGDDRFLPSGPGAALTSEELLSLAGPGAELTFTVVPTGSGRRIAAPPKGIASAATGG